MRVSLALILRNSFILLFFHNIILLERATGNVSFNVLLKRYLASRAVTSLQKLEGVKSSSPIINEGEGRFHDALTP